MSDLGIFGIRRWLRREAPADHTEQVQVQKALHRVMAFTGRSIHDIVNDPMAKRHVIEYYKLHKWVDREMQISDLEHQWNDVPTTPRRS